MKPPSNSFTGPEDPSLAFWAPLVSVLPTRAAIVDENRIVLLTNRPDETPIGSRIDEDGDGQLPWDLAPIPQCDHFRLATQTRPFDPALMAHFFSNADPLFVVYDSGGHILQANQAWEELLGYEQKELYQLCTWDLLAESDMSKRPEIERELRSTGSSEPAYRMRTASGEYRTVQWSLQFDWPLRRCFGIGRDITEELATKRDLTRHAYTDDLTDLANRRALLKELGRWQGGPFSPAILFCDLDKFKQVNDSLGHGTGDLVLQELARRLEDSVSGPDSTVARFGGDEFVVLLGAASTERAIDVAEKVLASVEAPFEIHGHSITVGMSIGIAVDHSGVASVGGTTLLEQADLAAYAAKRQANNCFVLFNSTEMKARVA